MKLSKLIALLLSKGISIWLMFNCSFLLSNSMHSLIYYFSEDLFPNRIIGKINKNGLKLWIKYLIYKTCWQFYLNYCQLYWKSQFNYMNKKLSCNSNRYAYQITNMFYSLSINVWNK